MLQLNVEKGTASKAYVPGYYIGGKTGTADKVEFGRYSKTRVLTDFMAVMPADQPRYLVLVMLDEPQALPETHGYKTSAGTRCRPAAPWWRGSRRCSASSRAWTCRRPISSYWPR